MVPPKERLKKLAGRIPVKVHFFPAVAVAIKTEALQRGMTLGDLLAEAFQGLMDFKKESKKK